MKTKLILIEGIPGSGKTTIANKTREYLESQSIKTALFCEGTIHPADLAWCSYIPIDEFRDIISKYAQYSQVINENTNIEGDHAVVAYTKLGLPFSETEAMKYFEEHEVYDGRVPLEQFERIHFKRWQTFAERAIKGKAISIFECAFFQNHISELMGMHGQSSDYITDHLISLISTVEKLNPIIIYLTQPDVRETIGRVAKERVSPDRSKSSDWIDFVIAWTEKSQYGRTHGLSGYDGAISLFEERKKVELGVIEKLPIDKYIIESRNNNWDDVFSKVKEILSVHRVINYT